MNMELILGFVMAIIGVISLGYTLNARKKFPEESELKVITGRLITIISLLTCFSVWHVIREAFLLKETIGDIMEYPEYAFITITFVMIFVTAKHIYNTAKQFGITK